MVVAPLLLLLLWLSLLLLNISRLLKLDIVPDSDASFITSAAKNQSLTNCFGILAEQMKAVHVDLECTDRTENRRRKTNQGAFVGSTKRVRLTTKKERSRENGERGDVQLITTRRVVFPAIIIRTQS